MNETVTEPKTGQLRIWHIPNPPQKGFRREVESIQEAIKVLRLLAEYDLHLGDLVHCNVQGCEVFEDGEWCEYYDEDGRDVREIEESLSETETPCQ